MVSIGGHDASASRREPVDEHLAPRVVAQQSDLREAVDIGEGLAEREKGSIEVGRDAERVGERGELRGGIRWEEVPSAGARKSLERRTKC